MLRTSIVIALTALGACGGNKSGDGPDAGDDAASGAPEVVVPRTGITAEQLAVLVNDDDPLSVQIAAYYVTARGIPAANVVHLHVPAGAGLSVAAFMPLKAAVDTALAGTAVQAMAITWTQPYVVDYMSITDRKSTRLNSSHLRLSRMPSSA